MTATAREYLSVMAARYHAYRELLLVSLPAAVKMIEAEYRMQKDRMQRFKGISRMPIMVASELRLILRWMRRFRPEIWDELRACSAATSEG